MDRPIVRTPHGVYRWVDDETLVFVERRGAGWVEEDGSGVESIEEDG